MLKKRKIPMRQCVGCRESKPKNELIRILKTPMMKSCLILPAGRTGAELIYVRQWSVIKRQ